MRRGPRTTRAPAPVPDSNELRVNRRIRVPRVLVIDEAGQKLGEFMTQDAVRLAEERGLDLVEVAPNARPPVCRITDYGQMKYEKKKKDAQARKNQIQQQLKEVKVRPKTDDHDMGVKVRHAKRFLEEGNKVKVTVRFRGREMAHREIGAEQCNRVATAVGDLGIVESPPRMEGRNTMFMIIAPTRKPVKKKKEDENVDTPPEDMDDELHEPDDDDDDDDDEDDEDDVEDGEEPEAAAT